MRLTALLVALTLMRPQAVGVSDSFSVETVHGRCAGCRLPFELRKGQFLNETEGWATGVYTAVTDEYVSRLSTLLHTSNGGSTWTPARHQETYGVEVEPAFSFIDAKQGWVAWPEFGWRCAPRPGLRTEDAVGRTFAMTLRLYGFTCVFSTLAGSTATK
jgi:hypothetical protein